MQEVNNGFRSSPYHPCFPTVSTLTEPSEAVLVSEVEQGTGAISMITTVVTVQPFQPGQQSIDDKDRPK